MSKLQSVRGTRDIFGDDARRFSHVITAFCRVASDFGFEEMSIPVFEFTDVFKRPLGDASDIVTKEMYSFTDRGGEAITLRPEFTAGIIRAFISNGMQQMLPVRAMSWGPVFRYERPQKGRYRQFHQINAECLGLDDPETDVEMLLLGWRLLEALGVSGKVALNLNTLGDPESRNAYRLALVDYFTGYKERLSEESQMRLQRNPLRILDSRDEGDKVLIADAPLFSGFLNGASKAFFARVMEGLGVLGVPFTVNERLVRGLDYYTHTAFEFVTDALGAQGAVLAGGRYDGLVAQMGGPATPGIGFAGGIERLAMLLDDAPPASRPIAVLPMGDSAILPSLALADRLRASGFEAVSERRGNLAKKMKRAASMNATHAVILGEDEIAAGTVTVKTLATGEQATVAESALIAHLKAWR